MNTPHPLFVAILSIVLAAGWVAVELIAKVAS